jgi:hypothetical protein
MGKLDVQSAESKSLGHRRKTFQVRQYKRVTDSSILEINKPALQVVSKNVAGRFLDPESMLLSKESWFMLKWKFKHQE